MIIKPALLAPRSYLKSTKLSLESYQDARAVDKRLARDAETDKSVLEAVLSSLT
jgi:hypothetical protein